jgi:CheY-like chemotaxis protein
VHLEVRGAGDLWTTRIDPPQLENALLNLCINARDAMLPSGGRLVIATANELVDASLAAERELAAGEYAVVSVTDTGAGMSQELIARIFDPFFTTKPLGQGTGLGLSMVYGFVHQSGGQVRVFSEVGKGTTMCLYLPRHEGQVAETRAEVVALSTDSGRGETVLLIEDQESIRIVVAEVLESAGYRVVATADGPSGLKILQGTGRVDLLITDVGLPGGLNGRQVADAGRVGRPDLKVLFITGYAENAAVRNGQLESGMEILTKPFDLEVLARRVREMIRPP